MVGILLKVMVENMDELDGKQYKVIETTIFAVTFLLRCICFYNVPGITTRNGWAAPIHSKELFLAAVLLFLIATWVIRLKGIRLLLQLSSLALVIYCEKIFVDYSDYKLKWTTYGLWTNILIIIVLQLWCLYTTIKEMRKCQ